MTWAGGTCTWNYRSILPALRVSLQHQVGVELRVICHSVSPRARRNLASAVLFFGCSTTDAKINCLKIEVMFSSCINSLFLQRSAEVSDKIPWKSTVSTAFKLKWAESQFESENRNSSPSPLFSLLPPILRSVNFTRSKVRSVDFC